MKTDQLLVELFKLIDDNIDSEYRFYISSELFNDTRINFITHEIISNGNYIGKYEKKSNKIILLINSNNNFIKECRGEYIYRKYIIHMRKNINFFSPKIQKLLLILFNEIQKKQNKFNYEKFDSIVLQSHILRVHAKNSCYRFSFCYKIKNNKNYITDMVYIPRLFIEKPNILYKLLKRYIGELIYI